jgi:uncharacterized protein YqhQ
MKKGLGVQMKPSGIGGMAVMEGVMMRNKDAYAVAVRKPNHEIIVEKTTCRDFSDKVKLFKLPIFRGMLTFVDSLVVGLKVLNYSTGFIEEEEEHKQAEKKRKKSQKKENRKKNQQALSKGLYINTNPRQTGSWVAQEDTKEKGKTNPLVTAFVVIFSIVLSIGLFMVLPVLITNYLQDIINYNNKYFFDMLEGILRLIIFIGYIIIASQESEIKRVFMYHGAEHKSINCLEHGYALTVENVRIQSRKHKRCGTSFMLLVMLLSMVFYIFLPTQTLSMRIVSRILLVPIISGVSYEIIRLSGKTDNFFVNIISAPGLLLQRITTKEPDDSMIEVAIQSVDAVFDWRAFLATPQISGRKKKETLGNPNLHPVDVNYSKSEKPVAKKPTGRNPVVNLDIAEEEDDEILRALDKYIS